MPPFLLILHWKAWWNVRLGQWKTRPFAEHLICVSSCFWRLGSVGVKMAPHVGTFSLEKHCCSQCSIDAKMFSWIGTKLCAADTGWHFLMVRCASFRRSLWFGNRDLFWVLPIWNQALIGQFEIIFLTSLTCYRCAPSFLHFIHRKHHNHALFASSRPTE